MILRVWIARHLVYWADLLCKTRRSPRTMMAKPVGGKMRVYIGKAEGSQLFVMASLDMKPHEFAVWCDDMKAQTKLIFPNS